MVFEKKICWKTLMLQQFKSCKSKLFNFDNFLCKETVKRSKIFQVFIKLCYHWLSNGALIFLYHSRSLNYAHKKIPENKRFTYFLKNFSSIQYYSIINYVFTNTQTEDQRFVKHIPFFFANSIFQGKLKYALHFKCGKS